MEPEIVVVAHNLRSAHNVGSLFRTCEGLGVKQIFLSGYTPHPSLDKADERLPHVAKRADSQIDKTALGAQQYQSWQYIRDINEIFKVLSSKNFRICALEQSAESIPLPDFKPPPKVALIIGNEVTGLDKSVLDKAETILEIPMQGQKESFNVVQASAMALYSLRFLS